MNSIKGINKKFTGLLSRRDSSNDSGAPDSPDANAGRAVKLFCESSSASNPGEEVLHLPVIVENAESSPQAAAAAAYQIRKFLSQDNYNRPHVQYNAIMLIGILADNPGPSFTKNFDKKFVDTISKLLRNGYDPSVQQIMRETLDRLEVDKAYDRNLEPVFVMWRKEKGAGASFAGGQPVGRTLNAPGWNPNGPPIPPSAQALSGSSNYFARNHSAPRGLPAPVELAGRVEEAKTSAKLLQQLVQSTPPEEVLSNDLIKEFAERCQSAQRSMQGYINCDNPPPDHDTLQTLIETNEQLSLATSKHQRAVLSARRAAPSTTTPTNQTPYAPPTNNGVSNPSRPPIDTEPDATDVSYAAPDRRPTDPNLTNFNAPSGPPPSLQARLQQRDALATNSTSAAPSIPASELPSSSLDPFSDDHAPPHPLEPMNYGPSNVAAPPPQPPRPAAAAYERPSYNERQDRAANGLTMHGADTDDADDERESEVSALRKAQHGRGDSASASATSGVSPVETRAPAFRY
ncbi:MAG: hypothetical protein M1820_003547 [Bogoriella megaspora]|nr:MAG: hypothetical protein M1820_003547 [Bogoriella megaspora]